MYCLYTMYNVVPFSPPLPQFVSKFKLHYCIAIHSCHSPLVFLCFAMQELLSMIELDIVSHDMFDLPPLSEYELYVKKFGADDTRQVSQVTA